MSLPAWLDPLLDAERMRRTDAWAIEERGVPGLDLMERAGDAVAEAAAALARAGKIVVVCGKGNNGGDGLVAARRLRERGRVVDVRLLGAPEDLRGDARTNGERLPGEPPSPWAPEALEQAAAVVDAVLGTGFSGAPRDPAASALEAMSAAEAPVLAVDVPSGVDGSTGEVAGVAVRAAVTVTFHRAKPGLWIFPGKAHAGRVEVVDIGIPPEAPVEADVGLITPAVLAGIPRREPGATKFSSGNVLVIGGSRGLTGAPCLAAEGAMRAGAGYVTAAVPASLEAIFELRLLEVMTVGLPDADGRLAGAAFDPAVAAWERSGAVVLGPGFGRDDETLALARRLAQAADRPLVLDADGLNAHAGRLDELAAREAPTVLTPHAGELGRLLGVDSAEVGARRLEHARTAATRAQAIVVLKGDDSLVACPDGVAAVSPGGAPGLATAGSGDVLSGVIGALLAKRMDPFGAVCAAVLGHVRAGRAAAAPHGPEGVIARDVVDGLPGALAP